MKIFQIVEMFFIVIFLCGMYLFTKFYKKIDINNKVYKIFSYILIFAFAFRFLSSHEEIASSVALIGGPIESKFLTALSSILIWLGYFNVLVLILYPFFEIKTLKNIVRFISLPISTLTLCFTTIISQAYWGSNAFFLGFGVKTIGIILFGVENALIFCYALVISIENSSLKMKKTDVKNLIISVLLMMLCTIPAYTFQVLFGLGGTQLPLKGLKLYHRIFIYISIILPLLIFFGLKNKNITIKKFSLLFLSLGTLIIFSFRFKFPEFTDPTSWTTSLPLHLCNTAMYLIVLCLVFKWKRLFYFTYFINVLGAFLAMAMPNYSETFIFSRSLIVFWVNHWCAFFMPLLIVALGLFERPKLKQFLYSIAGFTLYFVVIVFINAWFSNYAEVDYFFVNSDFVAKKLGRWAEDTRNITLIFNIGNLKFVLYPLYQFGFWLVYNIASLGMWFIYENGFAVAESFKNISLKKKLYIQSKMDLIKDLNGRSEEEPMNEFEDNKLILRNFSKKYGTSSRYAVNKANLEVCGGEVFGFLGPNGAGKSTIIKSIVGIQPLTSGSISVCGYSVEKQPVMAKKQIGFVPDHYALYEKLTGREYINYTADLYNVSKEDRDKRIKKYVKLFELEGAFDNKIKTYSHGMKQKITIIAALVHNPKVWILDEPLTGLDPNSIYQVKQCMIQHAKEGKIVFFSSHIIDVVSKICNKIAIIKKGKILCVKSMNEINELEGGLEKFYLNVIDIDEEKNEALTITNNLNLDKSSNIDNKSNEDNLSNENNNSNIKTNAKNKNKKKLFEKKNLKNKE